jgi:uncharacterized protein
MSVSERNVKAHSAIWKRHDLPGHEACRVLQLDTEWQLEGSAVFSFEGNPCRLDYEIGCDRDWITQSARIRGWVSGQDVDVRIGRTLNGGWSLNGRPVSEVAGCVDVDLNFSPSTNLLPIRRLNLSIGQSQAVQAAWLRFPSFTLEVLDQTYTRLSDRLYQYVSSQSESATQVTVDDFGLAITYDDSWSREPST